jgi:hypothetical protein
MSINEPKNISEFILKSLQNGPISLVDLVEKIRNLRPKTTKQAVYSAIRSLTKDEIVVTYKGVASLSLTWLNAMTDYFDNARINFIKGEYSKGNFIDLADKEKIKYYFNDPIKTDVFWSHALYLLVEKHDNGLPVYIYNPHEWFLLIKHEHEKKIFERIVQKGHRLLLTTGCDTYLDKYVRIDFNNDQLQYFAREKPLFMKNNYYINIIGDFLIEVWLDQKMSDEIDLFYQKTTAWDEKNKAELMKIIQTEGRVKLTISRNRKKAMKIRNSLKRSFIIN